MTLSPTKAALPVVAVVAYRHEVDTFDGQGYSCSKTILTENPRPNWHAGHEITAIEESVPLVRQSDALTAIAEQAGEVERLKAMLASHEESIEQFKRAWMKIPAFADKVNKATRYAITEATSIVVNAPAVARAALKESP